jgi:hypothetical protein
MSRHRRRGARRRFPRPDPLLLAVLLIVGALLSSCATTGSTVGSGVGERILQRPPYYAGAGLAAPHGEVGHFPVAYQRGATQAPLFDPPGGTGTAVGALLAEMNAYLDALGVTVRVDPPAAGTPPDVQFGCSADITGECVEREAPHRPPNPSLLRLAVARPSSAWIEGAAARMAGAGADHALLLTLEVGQLWPEQKNLRGDKVVRLGTAHEARVPWLTSLDASVAVVQLTGALIGADGRAVRIGAEGLLARPTPLLASAFGLRSLISDDDVARLRTERRQDLVGSPLVWQAAIDELVVQLTGRSPLASR